MGYSDRQGTCECHLQAILSSFHKPLHILWSMLWSPCVHWEDSDNCHLSVILTRFSDENTIQLLEEKNQKGRTSFTKFLHNQKSFLSSFFFHFYCLYYLGENETNDHYWFLKHVARGTWEDGAVGEVKPQVWPSGKFGGKMIGSWDLTDQPAWQNQWPPGSEEAFLKLKNKVQSNEARHPKPN